MFVAGAAFKTEFAVGYAAIVAMASRVANSCATHGTHWEGKSHKGIPVVTVPLLSMCVSVADLFCSPSFSICLHLAPTGEGQSIDLLSPAS